LRLRDGERCHLCRGALDFRLPWPAPLSVEIDHLVPFSVSGDDDDANLALAHRLCNMRRGTGGEVQLRLVG
jgi:hypothetical protein